MTTVIHDLFKKDINRSINGVIKADDNDELNLKNEIEEYVVTNDIAKNLSEFIDAYNDYDGARGNGVWISGFFGSGKSHLLKMLAVILQDRKICGHSSMDLFLDRLTNVNDSLLKASLKKSVTQYQTENILFNIDQKASAINKTDTSALLGVFLRVFNEHCGYYGKEPYIAKLERILDQDGEFDAFKQAYQEITGKNWEKDREKLFMVDVFVAKALAKIKGGTPDDYKGTLKGYKDSFSMSPGDFCSLVSDYVKKKGKNFRLNFFVDEIGQYIADNVQLMLNLQTISETLTTKCGSQAWIIVTAQEDMETVMGSESKQQSNDFSKIQDRFKLRIKLSSQDVAEVIQKRLLDKKTECKPELQNIYDREKNNFKTLFNFVDQSRTYRNYKDDENFIDCYPFVPYQFDLFQDCIRALSDKNAFEGKHSSVGERSMLGVFQEVVKTLENQTTGTIASFDLMFEGIRNQIKSRNQGAILRAETSLPDVFAVKVLKALLLVKYVDGFKATIQNITILMQSAFDEDRNSLRQKVDEALDRLVRETYIEKHGTEYSFLTDDEKDIEESINNTSVDNSELNDKINELFFKKILKGTKIRDPETGGDHSYTTIIDCTPYGKPAELGINLISPLSVRKSPSEWMSERANEKELVVVLPDDDKLYPELQKFCRTQKFVRQNSSAGGNSPMIQAIILEKGAQNNNREQDLLDMLSELLERAKLFALGDDVTGATGSDAKGRIEKGFLKLVSKAYYKRNIVPNLTIFDEGQISSIISTSTITTISAAETEIKSFLEGCQRNGMSVSVNGIRNNFEKIPYGWVYPAVPCLLAHLYARKIISFSNGTNQELQGKELVDSLRNTRAQQGLLVKLQTQIPESCIIELKKFLKEYFGVPCERNDGKDVAKVAVEKFKDRAAKLQEIQNELTNRGWPKCEAVENAIKTIAHMANCQQVESIYDKLDDKISGTKIKKILLDDWVKYLEPLSEFMNNSNRKKNYSESFNLIIRQPINFHEISTSRPDLTGFTEVASKFDEIKELCLKEKFFNTAISRRIDDVKEKYDEVFKSAISSFKDSVSNKLNKIVDDAFSQDRYQKLSVDSQQKISSFVEKEKERLNNTYDFGLIQNFEINLDKNFSSSLYGEIIRLYDSENTVVTPVESGNGDNKQEGQQTITSIPPKVIPTVKNIKDLVVNTDKSLVETEDDIDRYLAQLKSSMLEAIKSGQHILVK
ncbi:BREX system P-loop protein BrxC [Succinimonas amylolytica]|uniref:BREX system P-loop protein BrxC n=1 Tax=Succinimonas amylolytica TaxID=83769 RepID=UPI0003604822|nr:BREX system P-loop protein BrxC [Succinimonas amylolytica]